MVASGARGRAHLTAGTPRPRTVNMVDLSTASFAAISEMSDLELTAEGAVEAKHIDLMGHMNVAWYLHWFDRGIWSFFARHGLDEANLARTRRGCFALEDHIRYLSELREGDELAVYTGVVEVRPKNLRLVQRMLASRRGTVAATREVVAVHIDLETRRSVPFSDEVRGAMESCRKALSPSSLDERRAQAFAQAWIAAWNARDVETVLSHYADDAVFVSPRARGLMGRARVEGKANLRAYWVTGCERLTSLRFTLDRAVWSAESTTLTVLYTAALGTEVPVRAVEVMRFRGDKIVQGEALYGAPAEDAAAGDRPA